VPVQRTREDATDSVTLDELLKLSRNNEDPPQSVPSEIPKLDWRMEHGYVANPLRGKVYSFLRWCIDWIEPSKY
jgi:hypothetical protein